MNKEKILLDLKKDFIQGRMISVSKSLYRKEYPFNQVVFNANIFIFNENINKYEKIWYGDLDINNDGYLLKEIAYNNETCFFVLSEHDGRFENEENQQVLNRAIWTTKDLISIVTPEFILFKNKEIEANRIKYEEERKQKELELLTLNNAFKIKKPKKIYSFKIKDKVKIKKRLLDFEFKKYKKEIKDNIKNITDEEELYFYKKYIIKKEYFSYIFLNKFLKTTFEIKDDNIDFSSFWAKKELFKILEDYDFRIMKMLDKDYKRENVKHYALAEICIDGANKNKINIKSYKNKCVYYIQR